MVTKSESRKRRHFRVRKKISGTADRPRLSVFRSARHIYAQLVDDVQAHTIVAASTMEPTLRAKSTGNTDAAKEVGRLLAERARAAGVTTVVFDRGGFQFHGRIAALAQAARESGLEF